MLHQVSTDLSEQQPSDGAIHATSSAGAREQPLTLYAEHPVGEVCPLLSPAISRLFVAPFDDLLVDGSGTPLQLSRMACSRTVFTPSPWPDQLSILLHSPSCLLCLEPGMNSHCPPIT